MIFTLLFIIQHFCLRIESNSISGATEYMWSVVTRYICRATSIIITHNHPSGTLAMSESDREVSRRIRQVGEIIGIRLDDHIIVACD